MNKLTLGQCENLLPLLEVLSIYCADESNPLRLRSDLAQLGTVLSALCCDSVEEEELRNYNAQVQPASSLLQ